MPAAAPPRLDEAQQQVVSHSAGPLLVLAGPGTGKTAAIVESVVQRIAGRGIDPSRVLVLTFSRKAAEELRERITMRLGRTTRQPLALTFHSYAYALVRREFALAGDEPPTLLSGPDQLLEVRRLLRGEAEDGGPGWPERLRPALATRGFAAELRDFLLRAAERGLDGRGLARLGRQRRRDDWVAAGAFLERYAGRFDLAPVPAYDYAEIVRIAAGLLGRAATRDRERQAYDAVLVDEYQDTDPAQEDLLHALAGDGRELIVVGDPDQSIYGFRGADTRAIGGFADRFRAPDGSPARVVALRTCRRSGPFLLSASRRVAARLPAAQADLDRSPERSHRALVPLPDAEPGTARIIIAATAAQEASVIADVLRRAHLMDGLAWSSMAVLVRSATRQLPVLQRALAAAGVPVTIAGDELPLAAEPGTRPLLALLDCALRPGALDEQAAADLLTGPLGGTDALGLRRLRRWLRGSAQAAGEQPADEPLAAALLDPRELVLAGDGRQTGSVSPGIASAVAAARRVAGLLKIAAQTARDGGTAHEVLWAVWDASGLAATWQQASASGGQRGAAADADLDAVVALFDAAARFTARLPQGSPRLFLDRMAGQEIVVDTLAERAVRRASSSSPATRRPASTAGPPIRSSWRGSRSALASGRSPGGWPAAVSAACSARRSRRRPSASVPPSGPVSRSAAVSSSSAPGCSAQRSRASSGRAPGSAASGSSSPATTAGTPPVASARRSSGTCCTADRTRTAIADQGTPSTRCARRSVSAMTAASWLALAATSTRTEPGAAPASGISSR